MKTKLTLLPLCLFALTSYAQLWSPEGAKWHHFFYSSDPMVTNNNGYMTTTYDRDTLINGEGCKLLYRYIMMWTCTTRFSPRRWIVWCIFTINKQPFLTPCLISNQALVLHGKFPAMVFQLVAIKEGSLWPIKDIEISMVSTYYG